MDQLKSKCLKQRENESERDRVMPFNKGTEKKISEMEPNRCEEIGGPH